MDELEALRDTVANDPRFRVTTHNTGFANYGLHLVPTISAEAAERELGERIEMAGLGNRPRYTQAVAFFGTVITSAYIT